MKFKDINSAVVEKRIEQFESQVDFELIPVLSQRSSYIEHVPWMLSLIFIIILSRSADFVINFLVHLFGYYSQHDQAIYLTVSVMISIFLSRWLSSYEVIQRLFISNAEKERQVFEKAEKILLYKRLSNPQSKNALLLYVSLLEKRIEIRPDPQMKLDGSEKIAAEALTAMVPFFKSKDYEKGILAAIDSIEANLKPRYPRIERSDNLIANKLIWLKD